MNSMQNRIRRARTLVSLTQAQLAHLVGVSRSAVTQWERADGTTPNVEHIARIAHATGTCFEWLGTGRGPTRPSGDSFDSALLMEEFASDEFESRALRCMKRLGGRKKEVAASILELLASAR